MFVEKKINIKGPGMASIALEVSNVLGLFEPDWRKQLLHTKMILRLDSCCSTVDSAVASDAKGPGFESVLGKFQWTIALLLLTVCWKDENEEKETGNGPF